MDMIEIKANTTSEKYRRNLNSMYALVTELMEEFRKAHKMNVQVKGRWPG
jgi:hypothetical protein